MNGPDTAGLLEKRMERISSTLIPVTRERLDAIPITPRGERSSRWAGVQHGVLAASVLERAGRRGIDVSGESWRVSEDGGRLFGTLDLDPGGRALAGINAAQAAGRGEDLVTYGGFDPRVVSLKMGVLASNDSSFAFALWVIARVLVCSNGMTVQGGHITARRKHTTGIVDELPEIIDHGLDLFVERAGTIESTRRQLVELDFTRQSDVDHTLVEAGRRGVLAWSKLGQVEKEWREPRHPEFADRNGWSLMNTFTQIAKRLNPIREIQAADQVRTLILETAPNAN